MDCRRNEETDEEGESGSGEHVMRMMYLVRQTVHIALFTVNQ